MAKSKINNMKPLGNENSYTPEFFDELYKKINLDDRTLKSDLARHIILASQKYIFFYNEYQTQIATYEAEKELKKIVNHIDKASESLLKVISSGNYGEDIVNNLHDVISKKYPPLHGMLNEIIRGNNSFIKITSPLSSLPLLSSMAEAIEQIIKKSPSRKTAPKSIALYHWVMILSAKLEPIIGHKLEQSHYYKEGHKGEYISKKDISDSELLYFIINPIDPNVTISQIETAIKDTRKERHNAPWNNYF